jgi:hypothetical protein
LLWYYPDHPMHNSAAPIAELPDEAPMNFLFHHHLGVNLKTHTSWFQEAGEHYQWHAHPSRAQVGLDRCLELAVPWDDMPEIQPDWPVRIVVILADEGRYKGYLPENGVVPVQVP